MLSKLNTCNKINIKNVKASRRVNVDDVEVALKLWQKVVKKQKLNYDAHHKSVIFNKDEKIFLRNINIRTLRFKKKIDHHQLKFFIVIKKINSQAYHLKFLKKYDVIHNVFHVLFLKSWYLRDKNSKSQFIRVEDEKKWKMKEMFDKRIKKGEF